MKIADFLLDSNDSSWGRSVVNFLMRIWRMNIPPPIRRFALHLLTMNFRLGGRTRDASRQNLNPAPASMARKITADLFRIVSFYLPQFHPIPQNDSFWGEGFTEWTNVSKAVRLFDSHEQPKIPTSLGFYDLSSPEAVFKKQVALAKSSGVSAFCFHYYWFDGEPVMETPINSWLGDKSIDFGFMINWANENWTRRWDGLDSEVLLKQNHTAEDDLQFISHVAKYLLDPRYLRISGRPVLMVYRPTLFPDPRRTSEIFRKWFRENGHGELYLVCGSGFEEIDPADIGFDAAVDYPPNGIALRDISGEVNAPSSFKGRIHRYSDLVAESVNRGTADYTRFRTIVPAWDNTARKSERAAIYVGSTPEQFASWAREAIEMTFKESKSPDERIVFVNAWNEWAEGAYLEPDFHSDHAYLNALSVGYSEANASILRGSISSHDESDSENRPAVVFVTHDCNPNGAQMLSLSLISTLTKKYGLRVTCIALGGGHLAEKFKKASTSFYIVDPANAKEMTRIIQASRASFAIVNSAASFPALNPLHSLGIQTIHLVHEMTSYLSPISDLGGLKKIASVPTKVVFPAARVADEFLEHQELAPERIALTAQGTYKKIPRHNQVEVRRLWRNQIGLPPESKVVLGVGYGDNRKGFDYFVEVARLVRSKGSDYQFVWAGNLEPSLEQGLSKKIDECGTSLHLLGHVEDPSHAYLGADFLLLSSREDPYPSVLLEAHAAGLSILAFDCGGGSEFIDEVGGELFSIGDVEGVANFLSVMKPKAKSYIETPDLLETNERFSMGRYINDLFALLEVPYPKISVAVPSFNQGRTILECLESIDAQTLRPMEVVIFDDLSSDDTLLTVDKFMRRSDLLMKVVTPETKQGNASWSWEIAARELRGDYLWILEADDVANPEFLKQSAPLFISEEISMVAAACAAIDESGLINEEAYTQYLSSTGFSRDGAFKVFDFNAATRAGLGWKNTIPHIGSVLFRREKLLDSFQKASLPISDFVASPDWALYLEILGAGRMGYLARQLTLHRRQGNSVVGRLGNAELSKEAEIIHRRVADLTKSHKQELLSRQAEFMKEISVRRHQ